MDFQTLEALEKELQSRQGCER